MPRRRNNKRNNKRNNTINIDKQCPPPLHLMHQWLLEGDMKPLSMMKELNWCHLINEPFRCDADWEHNPDRPEETIFRVLCRRGDTPLRSICWMIYNGADVRGKDEDGMTAMHYAVCGKCPCAYEALVATEHGQWLLKEKNNYGDTPIDIMEQQDAEDNCPNCNPTAPLAEAVPVVEAEPIVEAEAEDPSV
jgi:hypothetical protein